MSISQVTPDLEREARLGFAEVIYCPGKTDEQLREMAIALFAAHRNVLASRCTPEQAALLQSIDNRVKYHQLARTAYLHEDHTDRGCGIIGVVTAGSTDAAVAEEAAITAEVMGNRVLRVYDVGVAGIHRLLARRALPSVVGGLVPCPVIAVPTSIGYGASLNGLTALMGMLCSCAPGVTVVNIDNGFGAGYAAARINARRI